MHSSLNENSTMSQNSRIHPKYLYTCIKNNLCNLKFPSRKWVQVVDPDNKIEFLRIEDDLTAYLVVCLDAELNVQVYCNKKLVKWFEWEKPQTEKDVEKILQIVNDCIVSRLMFVSDSM